MDGVVISNVFEIITKFLPNEWSRVVFYACYTEGSYSMKFYFTQDGSKYTDCFHIPGVSRAELIKAFLEIDKNISTIRHKIEEDKRWSVFTMMVDEDRNVKAEFDYDNHAEDMIEYESKWMDKYLN